ncbi:hypothetical protein HWB99_gp095 [Mycobacterium phage DrLupo]|uniref:Uncharacterized protein n=1 Tax=Mycobacterium phage DrLupo TaxID=2499037 RepID=A0A3S9UQS8_9CAUD|nr:hypothetical protein HWB99_gp095 [Mycobacterium phage DrLupo]AZS12631.1 hypothetical protein SEA_DRLUPO_95 [Mycobacterium phage DrLupo]
MDGKPIIKANEPRDEHNKFYSEASFKAAVKEFQFREGLPSYSQALYTLVLLGFQSPGGFGGYEIR